MRDKLESYILENRDKFNDVKAPEGMWKNIDSQLHRVRKGSKRNTSISYLMSGVAATILIMVMVASAYFFGFKKGRLDNRTSLQNQLQVIEDTYQKEVNLRLYHLRQGMNDPAVKYDLQELDAIYLELRAELLNHPMENTDRIIHSLQKNYQIKIDLLDRILKKQASAIEKYEEEINI